MWKPDLHPRDEYGRFRLSGASGTWDRLAGRVEAHAHGRAIAEYQANQARQDVLTDRRHAQTLTDAEDAEWDVLGERATHLARNVLPKAYHMGQRPHDDGTWRSQPGHRQYAPTNALGQTLPPMLLAGAVRVGDHPEGRGINEGGKRNASPQANGVWHRPGEYAPGRVPILRNDWGHPMGQLMPKPSQSREHRNYHGAFARAEYAITERLHDKDVRRKGREVRTASPEVHAVYQHDPRNPVGRRRTAPGHRRRQDRTTWIQRLNAQMEGR